MTRGQAIAATIVWHAFAGMLVGLVLVVIGVTAPMPVTRAMHCPDETVACALSTLDTGAALAGQTNSGVRNR